MPADPSAALLLDPGAAMLADSSSAVLAYHQRTKHHLARYAAGPETLDWDAQPDPFRRFAGAPFVSLPLPADGETVAWNTLFSPGAVAPHLASLESLGLLFELSFALSAWKEFGPDRWAQRCNPSSGNLHPTEVYLLTRGCEGLDDGLYHYAPKEHGLEQRALFGPLAAPEISDQPGVPHAPSAPAPRLLVGFSSIHWREAWKYGERAFRYCQLDLGHAIGALRYAAAVLGWRVQPVALTHAEIATLLGLDRDADFANAEREEPEAVFELILTPATQEKRQARQTETGVGVRTGAETDATSAHGALVGAVWPAASAWHGQANRLDPHPMYRWPVIDQVAEASRRSVYPAIEPLPALAARRLLPATDEKAAHLIRSRRSAQRFDRRAHLEAEKFWPLLAALMPRARDAKAIVPWDISSATPQVHAVLFAHRIDGLTPGAYLLPRDLKALPALQTALAHLAWTPAPGSPADIPLYALSDNPALAGTLRTLSCHQAIGADAVFVVALIAPFHAPIERAPWHYRALLQEAGLIGQVLYLEAEAAGLRGTGIGCYFDDAMHELLGLAPQQAPIAGLPAAAQRRPETQDTTSVGPQPNAPADAWQVLYHFSIGLPVPDTRITSSPPYDKDHRP